MRIRDSLTLDASGLKKTKDGYLTGTAKVARAGNVQQYLGSELGLTGDDANKAFGVYRDPDTVFAKDSMMTLAGRPVTRNHPKEAVTSANWKDLAIGHVGGTVARDGEHLVAPMVIMDASAVALAESGSRFLSAGYTVDTVPDEGMTEDGTSYQYRQNGRVRFNHVALLDGQLPRAGNTQIGDSAKDGGKDRIQWGAAPITNADTKETPMSLRKLMVDGLQVETTDAGAQAIEKLLGDIAQLKEDAKAAETAKQDAIDAKDADIAKKDAKIEDLESKVLDDAAIDAKVTAKSKLLSDAKAISPELKFDGMSDADIRKAVVTDKLGADALKDKSEVYIDARFDILAEDSAKTSGDAFRDAAIKSDPKGVNDAAKELSDAKAGYLDNLNNAWKHETKGAA